MNKLSQELIPEPRVGTVIELFAGVGGFRLGLEANQSWRTIFSNQYEPSTKRQDASSCYQKNFGSEGHSNEDIAEVVSRHLETGGLIPSADLLVGGFPCQDYSVAKALNSAKGLEGKKGVLWWEIYKIVKDLAPKYVFLENVDRLLKSPSSQRGRDFAIMLRSLGDLGYLVEWRVVNAAEQGFPQRRIRVFIVAKKIECVSPLNADPEHFLERGGLLAKTFPGSIEGGLRLITLDSDLEMLTKNFPAGKISPFANSGFYQNGKVFTGKIKFNGASRFEVLGDVVEQDLSKVPESYWIDDAQLPEWKRQKGAKSVERVHRASGTRFNYSEGAMAFPDLLSKPARTIVTGEGGSTPSRFKHVIQQSGRFRRLMPVELEKLNGFPPDWTKYDADGNEISPSRRAFFMGNALVVGIIEKIGKTIHADLLEQEPPTKPT